MDDFNDDECFDNFLCDWEVNDNLSNEKTNEVAFISDDVGEQLCHLNSNYKVNEKYSKLGQSTCLSEKFTVDKNINKNNNSEANVADIFKWIQSSFDEQKSSKQVDRNQLQSLQCMNTEKKFNQYDHVNESLLIAASNNSESVSKKIEIKSDVVYINDVNKTMPCLNIEEPFNASHSREQQLQLEKRKFPGPAGLLWQRQTVDDISKCLSDNVVDCTLENKNQSKATMLSTQALDCVNLWEQMKKELEPFAVQMLKYFNVAGIVNLANTHRLPRGKVPVTCLMISAIKIHAADASVKLKDSSGEIEGTIHRQLVKQYVGELRVQTVLVLRQVAVFSPGGRRHYLNITPNNVVRLYSSDDSCVVKCMQLGTFTAEDIDMNCFVQSNLRKPLSLIAGDRTNEHIDRKMQHTSLSRLQQSQAAKHMQHTSFPQQQHSPLISTSKQFSASNQQFQPSTKINQQRPPEMRSKFPNNSLPETSKLSSASSPFKSSPVKKSETSTTFQSFSLASHPSNKVLSHSPYSFKRPANSPLAQPSMKKTFQLESSNTYSFPLDRHVQATSSSSTSLFAATMPTTSSSIFCNQKIKNTADDIIEESLELSDRELLCIDL